MAYSRHTTSMRPLLSSMRASAEFEPSAACDSLADRLCPQHTSRRALFTATALAVVAANAGEPNFHLSSSITQHSLMHHGCISWTSLLGRSASAYGYLRLLQSAA
eukprot:6173289-Pleurochrysis_carterae.AAC.3